MLAGRDPSTWAAGTVNRSRTSAPRRATLKSEGGAGTFTSGGSGGPFFPHAIMSIAAATSPHTDTLHHGGHGGHGGSNLYDLPSPRLTECTETDLRSSRSRRASSSRRPH